MTPSKDVAALLNYWQLQETFKKQENDVGVKNGNSKKNVFGL